VLDSGVAMSREVSVDGGAKGEIFSSGSLVEVILLLAMLIVAVGSGSLTLLGETIRSTLIMMTGVWYFVVLAKAARHAGQRYQFGTGKLEQAGNVAIALALAAAGLWLASRAFALIAVGKSEAEPFALALAATANAAHTVRTGFSVWARSAAKAGNGQPTYGVPSPVSSSRFVSLLIVQTALTVAAVARDPEVGLAADCLGAIFVGLLMTAAGVRMLWEAALDLIDHPLRGKAEEAIAQLLLEEGIQAEELVGMRSRRSGRDVFVELTMDPVETGSFEEARQRLAHVRHGLEDRLGGLDVSIRLHTPQG
jgi:divalent metal cation (Fe/Co/Zn/Cd) transporter